MKKLFLFLLVAPFVFFSCSDDDPTTVQISFEGQLTEEESEFIAEDGILEGWSYKTQFNDPSNSLQFSQYHYGGAGFAGGFTYTNATDTETPGYTNISAITGTGKFGTTYLTSYTGMPATITMLKADQYTFKSIWVTNSTYAYLAIKDGNDDYKNDTQFEEGNWFKLIITGYGTDDKSITEKPIEFYLANYTKNENKIINDWKWIDLSTIASAAYISFELSSNDHNEDGMKTPAYFCLDGITLEEK